MQPLPPLLSVKVAQELVLAYPQNVQRVVLSATSAKVNEKSAFIAWSNVEAIKRGEPETSKKVIVSPDWVNRVSWRELRVHVDLSRQSIKNAPEYDPSTGVDRDYEERLYNYYGSPKYWG